MDPSRYPSEQIIKVAATTPPNKAAGALAEVVRAHRAAEVQAIGAGAVNQAVKAIAIARRFVASNGLNLVCVPYFRDHQIDGEERTAIGFEVFPQR